MCRCLRACPRAVSSECRCLQASVLATAAQMQLLLCNGSVA